MPERVVGLYWGLVDMVGLRIGVESWMVFKYFKMVDGDLKPHIFEI